MPYTVDSARKIFPQTLAADDVPATISRFNLLDAEDQLALIWFAYLEMGKTLTVAALGAANMQFAERTLDEIKSMPFAEQSQIMLALANRSDNPICRTYASWTPNIKLGFWYCLAEWMDQGLVAPIPPGYELSANANAVLVAIRNLDAGKQITVLRNTVVDMGFDSSKLESQERVAETLVKPTDKAERAQITIQGVSDQTILNYMDNLNANDFDALIELFTEDGALQPPFRKPIVGKSNVLRFFREECQNLKLMPEQGVIEPAEDGFKQIKVTGTVQTPWFGAGVGMNIAWRFLLDPSGKIFFLAVDLLASPKELLNLIR
ncbi:MAG: orange carotenoid protein N-terminal domain-containing protein [Cyanobacteria bacterium P01_H01_bin.15]